MLKSAFFNLFQFAFKIRFFRNSFFYFHRTNY